MVSIPLEAAGLERDEPESGAAEPDLGSILGQGMRDLAVVSTHPSLPNPNQLPLGGQGTALAGYLTAVWRVFFGAAKLHQNRSAGPTFRANRCAGRAPAI